MKRSRDSGSGYCAGGRPTLPTQTRSRVEAGRLLAQAREARDQHGGAREQHDREADLRGDETAAEALLTRAARDGATAFLEAVDEISARALPRRIQAHQQPGE